MNAPRPLDSVFGLSTPILFAHRGGANEEPESTERAFNAALQCADALEIDVQVTRRDKDGERFVIWHGPQLDHVLISGKKAGERDKNNIGEYTWDELDSKAYVANPPYDLNNFQVAQSPDTRIMTLEHVLQTFPNAPLNIEMKKDTFRKEHVKRFLELLDQHRNKRAINVVSQSRTLLELFRKECDESYSTGLSSWEAIYTFAGGILPGISLCDLKNRALQTVHSRRLTPPSLIRKVHAAGGAVHVFLNAPDFMAIDARPNEPTQEQINELLDRGVDGIMTDRPRWVRGLIDHWLQNR